ncbi:MAG: hypothetical protein M3Z28_13785 [Candidatus Dormibacteraeota bacterium]|nr:hypothetical protein [Candidatus Dormibacteraeota bacterium]
MTSEATMLWWLALAIGVVVTVVAAVLLSFVVRVASQIDAGAEQIWITGRLVARNTAQIPLLVETNQVAADILEGSNGILMAAQRVLKHAQACPGCPACLVQAKGA